MSAPPRIRQLSSRDNPDYKRWLRLSRGRITPAGAGLLLQGEHLCTAWLDEKGLPDAMIVAHSMLQSQDWVARLWQRCEAVPRTVLTDSLAEALSQVDHGPAVFFLVQAPSTSLPARVERTCLWLDRIQDPGNLGTLLRTAAAAGVREAYLSTGCAAAWSSKVLRSGQGAHFILTIHEHVDLQALTGRLCIPLAATALTAADSLYDRDLRAPCAWLFGNEGQGVEPDLLRQAQWRLRIPQVAGVESLNVAAAAAICLFEQRRQRAMAECGRANRPIGPSH